MHGINLLLSDPAGQAGISIVFRKPPDGIAKLGLRHPVIMSSQRDKAQTCFLSTKIYKVSLLLDMGGYSFPSQFFLFGVEGIKLIKINLSVCKVKLTMCLFATA
jgi:hypothetical protein